MFSLDITGYKIDSQSDPDTLLLQSYDNIRVKMENLLEEREVILDHSVIFK